jgi:hypothetical protein
MNATNSEWIDLRVNERPLRAARSSMLYDVRNTVKPDADVVIHNGFPASTNSELRDGDQIVLIRRGEVPPFEELEALLVARHGPGVHDRVRRGRVGIAGCGGLGTNVAISLARIGVAATRASSRHRSRIARSLCGDRWNRPGEPRPSARSRHRELCGGSGRMCFGPPGRSNSGPDSHRASQSDQWPGQPVDSSA